MNKINHELFNTINPSKTTKLIKKDNPILYCPICEDILLMGKEICDQCLMDEVNENHLESADSKDK